MTIKTSPFLTESTDSINPLRMCRSNHDLREPEKMLHDARQCVYTDVSLTLTIHTALARRKKSRSEK